MRKMGALLASVTLMLLLPGFLRAACPVGDIYSDCTVNWLDIQDFAENWLNMDCSAPQCRANIDGVAGVTMADFAKLAANWLVEGIYPLVINEFMADNGGTIEYPDESGEFPDWFEIYNTGDVDIDIGGMYVRDDTTWWQIPAGHPLQTTVKARGHLLLWADGDPAQGPLHVDFSLGKNGDQVGIYDKDRTPIDVVSFTNQIEDRSRGRLPDGSNNWITFEIGSATPGATNRGRPVKVVINEIMYHPGHPIDTPENIGQEYIELCNKGEEPIGLLGWRFTNGINYSITDDIILGVGGYYVIAADVNAFKAKYPDVNNVTGGWDGRLSNSGETVELVDNAGVLIDKLSYADQGDWAVRELGPVDYRHRGWQWSDAHDGQGKSLELINPALPNEYGQNWVASQSDGGTPGSLNSVNDSDIAPLILDVKYSPIIPGPNDVVMVTAEILDELSSGVSARLHYRIDRSTYQTGDEDIYPHYNPGDYNDVPMFDDGTHGDGTAGDRLYGAGIPAHPHGSIIEFFVESRDAAANTRTWPAPSMMDGTPEQVTNALYQVDSAFDPASWTAGDQPVYYLILTGMEKNRLLDIGDPSGSGSEYNSNAQMNLTFVSVDGVDIKVRYSAGIRNRGHGSRNDPPNNYRINFANDRPWKNTTAAILNTKFTYLQLAGNSLFRLAGLTEPQSAAVQVRLNGQNMAGFGSEMYGSYVHLEVIDSDFAGNHFPGNSNGNAYKCMRAGGDHADLRYEGPVADSTHYREHYFKETNVAADDWSDLIGLTYALSDNTPDGSYVDTVKSVADVEQWLRFLAVNTILDNSETTLANGDGDDYYLYCGIEDPRFVLIQHDLDSIFGMGDTIGSATNGIFRFITDDPGIPALERLVTHPEFIRRYYWHLKDQIETTFSPEQLAPVLDELLGDFVPAGAIQQMKDFAAVRNAHILSLIPSELTVISDLAQSSGYHRTTVNVAMLYGTADAIKTRSVQVNGHVASWQPVEGEWSISGVALDPGINRIIVKAFDDPNGTGNEVDHGYIDIWYDDGGMSQISGIVTAGRILYAASGPWYVTGDISVPSGVTLTIEPGTTLFFDSGTDITVQNGGRLVAEGTEYRHIRLTSVPGGAHWDGVKFDHTLTDNRLTYVDHEFGDGQGESTDVQYSKVTIDNMTWSGTNTRVFNIDHPSVICRNSVFPSISGTEPLHGDGLTGDEYIIFDGCTFGTATGYNDVIDFTHARRTGPVFQIYNCLFFGGGDDGLDLDSVDAHVEGNVFMNFHGGGGDGTSNAVSTGDEGWPSEIYAARNIFIDNDHGVLLKEDSSLHAHNNVFINSSLAAVIFGEPYRNPPREPGRGAHMEGNIFWNNAAMFEFFFEDPLPDYGPTGDVIVDYSSLPSPWQYLGVGNIDADPLFVDGDSDFRLKPDSGAIGTGAWGLDMGAMVPAGAAISGEPHAVTYRTTATLTVGGPGITDYKYSVNNPDGPWTGPFSVDVPVVLTGLVNGQSYTVYAIGMNSAGVWQSEETPAASHTWTIDTSHFELLINEILAHTHGTDPDVIELCYDGPGPIDLTGISLTDNPVEPNKFEFSFASASTTVMNPGDYIILYGDLTTVQDHLGFALSADGEALYLYDKPNLDGSRDLIDSVEFGPQINDYSIGRAGWDRQWKLNQMTFGAANIAQPLGDPDMLKINEWLANGLVLFDDDFIELYNPHPQPVSLAGLYLTDAPVAEPNKSKIVPLSFIPPQGYAVFRPNGGNSPSELNFKLSADVEMIGLFDADLNLIDQVLYGSQTTDVSQGRAPDGAATYAFFELPTPGVANTTPPIITTTTTVLAAESATKHAIIPTSAGHVGETWKSDPNFDDSSWLQGIGSPGGVGFETGTGYEDLITLDVETQMDDKNETCYIRIPFIVNTAELGNYTGMTLKARYDDGFVAYINGVELETARRNFTGTPQWDSGATDDHSDSQAINFEFIDVSDYISVLRGGSNVLAIHGLNDGLGSSDFLISAELEVSVTTVDYGEFHYPEALDLLAGLRITEIMYHAPQGSNYDYIELKNISDKPLTLDGVRFIDGIVFEFPAMQLDPGEYVLVVENQAAFQSVYGTGLLVAGEYTGSLSNGGEKIVLTLAWPLDAAIMRFGYSDVWYPTTDGAGQSLTILDPTAHPAVWDNVESWRAAAPSPGAP